MLGEQGTAELGSHTSPVRVQSIAVLLFSAKAFRHLNMDYRMMVGCPLTLVRLVGAVIFLT